MMTAYIAKSQTRAVVAGSEPSTGNLATRLRKMWQDYLTYTRTVAELQALSDKQLADLGMRRSKLRAIARASIEAHPDFPGVAASCTRPDTDMKRNTTMANTTTFTLDSVQTENGLVARFRKMVADYRLYRQTLEELQSLSSRELADLGLSRASVRQIAREAVYGA